MLRKERTLSKFDFNSPQRMPLWQPKVTLLIALEQESSTQLIILKNCGPIQSCNRKTKENWFETIAENKISRFEYSLGQRTEGDIGHMT